MGIIGFMCLVKYSALQDYWRKKSMFDNALVRNTISRNIFKILLKMWHFPYNSETNSSCPNKIEKVISMFIHRIKNTPGDVMSIDESIIPWQGGWSFCQYNPRTWYQSLQTKCWKRLYLELFDIHWSRFLPWLECIRKCNLLAIMGIILWHIGTRRVGSKGHNSQNR